MLGLAFASQARAQQILKLAHYAEVTHPAQLAALQQAQLGQLQAAGMHLTRYDWMICIHRSNSLDFGIGGQTRDRSCCATLSTLAYPSSRSGFFPATRRSCG